MSILKNFLNKTKGDPYIWIIVIILSIFSILVVYSAVESLAFQKNSNPENFIIKHFFIIVFSFLLMFLAHKVDYRIYAKVSFLLVVLSIVLLLFTMFFWNKNKWRKKMGKCAIY